MSSAPVATNREMEFLQTHRTPDFVAASLNCGLLAASRFTTRLPGHGMSEEHLQEDAFMLSFQCRDYAGDLWVDGKKVDFAGSRQGNFTLYDYSRAWLADLRSSFDCVNFHVSRAALMSLDEDLGTANLSGFNIAPGEDIADPVIKNIVNSIVPMFDGHFETNQLLLDYIGAGLLVHLTSTYGAKRSKTPLRKGGLTPRQLNRALTLLDANLRGKLSLSELASACELSASYFARAFKETTGITPYQWLRQRRIDKATDLLRNASLSLKEIAEQCGFADQAHLTRQFSEAKGMPPGTWRRQDRPRSLHLIYTSPDDQT